MSLPKLLASLNRDQLQSLLLKLAEQEPSLVKVIERQVALLHPIATGATSTPTPATTAPPRRLAVDPKVVRRQIHSIMHGLDRMRSSEAYWQIGAVVNEVGSVLEQAWTLIREDDGRNALIVLEAITEEYIAEQENLDDSDGEVGDFFNTLGPAWTEALLSTDLTSEERQVWADKLDGWQQEIDDYGIDDAFTTAAFAATEGWADLPPQSNVPRHPVKPGNEDDEDEDDDDYNKDAVFYTDELVRAKLNILERRGQWQEYLKLAEAEGHTKDYVTMLVRLDRVEEAATYGRKHLATPDDALALAKALYEHGDHEQGLQIAEHGLTLDKPRTDVFPGQTITVPVSRAPLAKWLRDSAEAMGEMARALAAAEIAFRDEVNLANYLRVAEIAGEQWPERRPALLDAARQIKSYYPQGPIDVFLHEGLIDDAIAAVKPSTTHTLVEQVVDAALESRPEWVIEACRGQAEPIMNGGKSEYYDAAAKWLAKARTAYKALGHEVEWQEYLGELLTRHARKYKLVPLLKPLRW